MEFKILHIDYNISIEDRNMFDRLSKDCGMGIEVTNLALKKSSLKKYLDKFPLDTSLILNDGEEVANYFIENANKFDYVWLSAYKLESPLCVDKSDKDFIKRDKIFRKKMELKMQKDLRDAMLSFLDVNK